MPWIWDLWAHPLHQTTPGGDWQTWVILGGRGAGKTRAGAEWVRARHGIAHADVLAVGNDYNDLDLLEWAPDARVVANAPPDLRERFDTVPSNEADGFVTVAEAALARLGAGG